MLEAREANEVCDANIRYKCSRDAELSTQNNQKRESRKLSISYDDMEKERGNRILADPTIESENKWALIVQR